MSQVFIIRDELVRSRALDFIRQLPLGVLWKISIAEFVPSKSREQEEKYHAMIGDITQQCTLMEKKLDRETWKRLLVEQFVNEEREHAREHGDRDPFPSGAQLMPSVDGQRLVQLGVQTRRFTRLQAAAFIEFLYAFGSEREVVWRDKYVVAEREAA